MIPQGLLELRDESPRLLARSLRDGGDFADLFAESGTIAEFSLRRSRGRPSEQHAVNLVEGSGLRVVTRGSSRYRWRNGLNGVTFERLAASESTRPPEEPPDR